MAPCFADMAQASGKCSALRRRCGCPGGFQGGAPRRCQLASGSASPIVKEDHARLFTDHVMMDGDDLDAGFAQRFEGGLKFVRQDDEVAVTTALSSEPLW